MARKKEKNNWIPTCLETGKKCYATKKDASSKAHFVSKGFGNNMGYYKCEACKTYHLYTIKGRK